MGGEAGLGGSLIYDGNREFVIIPLFDVAEAL